MVGLDQGGLESHLSFLFFLAARIQLFALRFRSCDRHTRQFAESAMCFLDSEVCSQDANRLTSFPLGGCFFRTAFSFSALLFWIPTAFLFCCALFMSLQLLVVVLG
jgi:hypothetical protein